MLIPRVSWAIRYSLFKLVSSTSGSSELMVTLTPRVEQLLERMLFDRGHRVGQVVAPRVDLQGDILLLDKLNRCQILDDVDTMPNPVGMDGADVSTTAEAGVFSRNGLSQLEARRSARRTGLANSWIGYRSSASARSTPRICSRWLIAQSTVLVQDSGPMLREGDGEIADRHVQFPLRAALSPAGVPPGMHPSSGCDRGKPSPVKSGLQNMRTFCADASSNNSQAIRSTTFGEVILFWKMAKAFNTAARSRIWSKP